MTRKEPISVTIVGDLVRVSNVRKYSEEARTVLLKETIGINPDLTDAESEEAIASLEKMAAHANWYHKNMPHRATDTEAIEVAELAENAAFRLNKQLNILFLWCLCKDDRRETMAEIEKANDNLKSLVVHLSTIAKGKPTRKDRTDKPAAKVFTEAAAGVYWKYTGRKPGSFTRGSPTGPWFRFLEAALELIADEQGKAKPETQGKAWCTRQSATQGAAWCKRQKDLSRRARERLDREHLDTELEPQPSDRDLDPVSR